MERGASWTLLRCAARACGLAAVAARACCMGLIASFLPAVSRSPEAAAETVLFAATAPADQVGGRYCGTAPRVARHSAAADDEVLARQVWELSAHLCDLTADELAA